MLIIFKFNLTKLFLLKEFQVLTLEISKNFINNAEFLNFKKECDKTGTTEEALANAEKIGFKTNINVDHPFIKTFLRKFHYLKYINWIY